MTLLHILMKIYMEDIFRYVLNCGSRITLASKELVSFYSSCSRYTSWQKGHGIFRGTESKSKQHTKRHRKHSICLVLRPLICKVNSEVWILFLQYYTVDIEEFLGQKVDVIFGDMTKTQAECPSYQVT